MTSVSDGGRKPPVTASPRHRDREQREVEQQSRRDLVARAVLEHEDRDVERDQRPSDVGAMALFERIVVVDRNDHAPP